MKYRSQSDNLFGREVVSFVVDPHENNRRAASAVGGTNILPPNPRSKCANLASDVFCAIPCILRGESIGRTNGRRTPALAPSGPRRDARHLGAGMVKSIRETIDEIEKNHGGTE